MRMKHLALASLCVLASLSAKADEGMWMLNNIDPRTAEIMKELGLELMPRDLYNTNGPSLKDAVVDFGDFCSGVVVSPSGLVFTNHHCGYSSIQKLATPEDDILNNGFVAHSTAEERPVEGLFVRFLELTVDCTTRIKRGMEGLAPSKLDSVMNSVEEEYAEAYPDRYCLVKSYFGSSSFYASIYKVYNDVRLVLTGPQSLCKFGGETDNWMWPRQTCDFSVFRIYADANGDPADYSPDNVPLATAKYSPVSLEGYQPGDFCMTIGYPGSTSRYLSSYGVSFRVNALNVSLIDVRGKKQEVWKRWMDSDPAIALKYASKYAGSSNYWKNSIGMNKAVEDLQVVQEKERLEQAVSEWCAQDADLTARFGTVLADLQKAYADAQQATRAQGFFFETFRRGIEIAQPAAIMAELPSQPDSADLARAKERLRNFYKDYDPRVDQEVMAALLNNYRELVDAQFLPSLYATIDESFGGDCKAYAQDLFARTILTDSCFLERALADTTIATTDPGLAFALSVKDATDDFKERLAPYRGIITEKQDLLTQALLERDQDSPHYSDANFSMRLSYGFVQDYTANGTHYDYYTNSQSLLDKVARQGEVQDYRLEDDIVSLLKARDFGPYADTRTGDLQLCFLTNNDITGGNSGSPMFNGKGQLIGLAFDGNWEAMSGAISFDVDLQRCIGVDIRFVIYLIDKWGHAGNILTELGL